ncbi:unnamed protein product [Chrysodeixis includens]|uniref:Pyruvate kinase n=1 Tax=Chrysodeixis includens TaxID=689277 RepID=A0A9P0G0J1_CHRIL|nr:unnamed protein product [Chrysodeixis includens]
MTNVSIPLDQHHLLFHLKDQEWITIKDGSYIIMTGDENYFERCTETRIYMDDPYTLATLKVGTEITIDFGEIMLECAELIDSLNIKCLVLKGGKIKDQEIVCMRGVKHVKPALMKSDRDIISFAREHSFDIVLVNSVRYATTPETVRRLFPDKDPLIISAICEREGLENIDDIIKNSDAIILAREFLAYEIADKFKMISIQLYVSGKCKQYGRPLFISGNIMESLNNSKRLSGCVLNDITNIVQHKAGFAMRKCTDPKQLIKAMQVLNSICKVVEPLVDDIHFWRKSYEYKMPLNAAEAAVLGAVLMAQQTKARVLIVPTVSGKTVRQVIHMCQDLYIIAITTTALRANQLQLFRGVFPIIYDKKFSKNWNKDMDARIQFAVAYAIKFEALKENSNYVVLRKSLPTSSYNEHVSAWTVLSSEDKLMLRIADKEAQAHLTYSEKMYCPMRQ